jgi:pimeloyl-ACP methyl ester carboxylesterase
MRIFVNSSPHPIKINLKTSRHPATRSLLATFAITTVKLFIAILLMLTSFACQSRATKYHTREKLVSADAKEKVTAAELKNNYGQLASYIQNGYTAYTITYNTRNADGTKIVASGAIFVPDINSPLPLFNYNHGTIFPSQEKQAPSYIGYSYEIIMGKLFAGAGYLVVMPDYPGYGASKSAAHPYGSYHEIGTTVIDMLDAVKEFCQKQNIILSGKNFFSGWSEGAAVALGTVQALEKEQRKDFKPTLTVVNAGPYYTSGFVYHVIDAGQPLTYMNSYAWILQSYNAVYRINKPLNYYFTEPAATDLEKKGPETFIPRDPEQLFTKTFIENYKAGHETLLQDALEKNDLWNWKPESKIVFCHGDRDDYVPLFNSQKAYTAMKEKGADVTLRIFKGQNHSGGILDFVKVIYEQFEAAR